MLVEVQTSAHETKGVLYTADARELPRGAQAIRIFSVYNLRYEGFCGHGLPSLLPKVVCKSRSSCGI